MDPIKLRDHKLHVLASTTGVVNDTTAVVVLPVSSTCTITARVALYESTGPAGGSFEITARYVRGAAGGPVLVGAVQSVVAASLSASLAAAAVTFVIAGNQINFQVTGVAGLTIQWGGVITFLLHTP